MYLSRTYDTYIIYTIPNTTNTTTMDVDRVFPSSSLRPVPIQFTRNS